MSVSKKENKEDAVQLTQEDIQILSEYSWDMAGRAYLPADSNSSWNGESSAEYGEKQAD